MVAPTSKHPYENELEASAFFNDVCLRQMMTATPNDVRFANDVCLRAHRGKHRIIAKRSGATSYLRSKCIISPQAMLHCYSRTDSNRHTPFEALKKPFHSKIIYKAIDTTAFCTGSDYRSIDKLTFEDFFRLGGIFLHFFKNLLTRSVLCDNIMIDI